MEQASKLHLVALIDLHHRTSTIVWHSFFSNSTSYHLVKACIVSQAIQKNRQKKREKDAYMYGLLVLLHYPSNTLAPKFWNQEFLESIGEWKIVLERPWICSSSLPNNSWISLVISLTSSQNTHQCPHVCAPQQGNPTAPPQRHPLQLRVKKMPISIYFCWLSHNCPFKPTISMAKVLHQQIVLGLQCLHASRLPSH